MIKNKFLGKLASVCVLISFFVIMACSNPKEQSANLVDENGNELEVVANEDQKAVAPEVSIDKTTLTKVFNVLNVPYASDEEFNTLSEDVKVMYFAELAGNLSKVETKSEASIVVYTYNNMYVEEMVVNSGDSQTPGFVGFSSDLSKVLNLQLVNSKNLSKFKDAEIKDSKVVVVLDPADNKDSTALLDAVNVAISNLKKVLPLIK